MQGLANQIAALGRDVGIVFAEDLTVKISTSRYRVDPPGIPRNYGEKSK